MSDKIPIPPEAREAARNLRKYASGAQTRWEDEPMAAIIARAYQRKEALQRAAVEELKADLADAGWLREHKEAALKLADELAEHILTPFGKFPVAEGAPTVQLARKYQQARKESK